MTGTRRRAVGAVIVAFSAITVRLKADTTYETVRLKADTTYETVRLKADTTYETVRLKADTTYETVRLKADTTYETVRLKANTTSAVAAPAAAQAPASLAIPRAPDGRPDLSGFWQVSNTAAWDIQDHRAQKGVPAGQGVVEGNEIPYQPWAAAKKKENFENRATADPESKCYLPGVPRLTYMPFPFQIVQTPKELVLLHEYVHAVRTIHTDGSAHPSGPFEWWLGDARGHWDGDTLVVDLVQFNDRTWFDRAGNFHSDALHVVERFTPTGPDHIDYSVTIEDPKVFTRPWTMRMILYRHKEKNFQILEYECYGFDHEKYYP